MSERSDYMHRYFLSHKTEYARRAREWYARQKDIVIRHYSKGTMRCGRCGFADLRALSIDHIEGGGREDHRRYRGSILYVRLRKLGFPKGFQVLCMNCQFIKEYETGNTFRNHTRPR